MTEPKEAPSTTHLWKIWGPILLVVIAGFALAIFTLDPPPPSELRIATGSSAGAYHAFARRYQEILAHQGYDLEIVETAGTGENLELLRRGDVDLAFVQGGVASDAEAEQLESLASLYYEPVWVFARQELAVTRFSDLEGRRIAAGPHGSGVRVLAESLLEASGLGDCEILDLTGMDAVRALGDGTVDAAFFVASVHASYIEALLAGSTAASGGEDTADLISFRRHRAYSRRFPFLSRIVLGEGVFDLGRNLPPRDISLLTTAASLAARVDLHKALIPLLLETAREVHGPGDIFEKPGEFPSARLVDLPLKNDARLYLEQGPNFLHRFLPFRAAITIDRLKILFLPIVTLLIPLFKIGPPLFRWQIRSRIYRWYADLRQIDEMLRHQPSGDEVRRQLERLEELDRDVAETVSVPLSYMDELFHLRSHIDLIRAKLEKRAST